MKISIVIMGLALVALSFFCLSGGDKIRYVSMTQVFNECQLKEEYAKTLAGFEEQGKQQLLKLQDEVNAAKSLGDEARLKMLEEQFASTQQRLQEEFQKKSASFEQMIWKQINDKVAVYGKENDIDLILGAKGDGTIMYANDKKEITKEIIEYINDKK